MNYKDCPISQYEDFSKTADFYMMVAVFNPATAPIKHVTIAVPHGNFSAQTFNESSKKFEDARAQIICDNKNQTKC